MELTHAVEFKGITKRFGKNVANNNIDLYLDKGVIMSLLGENGSGKTTLMNMLAGIYFPDEGEIFINGEPATIRSPYISPSARSAPEEVAASRPVTAPSLEQNTAARLSRARRALAED